MLFWYLFLPNDYFLKGSFNLLSWSVLTTITEGGPSPFTVNATTEILYSTNFFSPVRLA